MHPFRVVSQTWIAIFGMEKSKTKRTMNHIMKLKFLLEGLKHDDDDFFQKYGKG